jgi:hypothetical protein
MTRLILIISRKNCPIAKQPTFLKVVDSEFKPLMATQIGMMIWKAVRRERSYVKRGKLIRRVSSRYEAGN